MSLSKAFATYGPYCRIEKNSQSKALVNSSESYDLLNYKFCDSFCLFTELCLNNFKNDVYKYLKKSNKDTMNTFKTPFTTIVYKILTENIFQIYLYN